MKILIPVDESECSELALQSVLDRDWAVESQFRIINVHEPFPFAGVEMYSPRAAQSVTDAEKDLVKEKRESIGRTVEKFRTRFPSNSVSGDILTGDIRETILSEERDWGADLIVMGSHKRKGLGRLLLGSVAESVAGNSSCSVEIVKESLHIDASGESKNEVDTISKGGECL